MVENNQNIYFIGINGVNASFVPVSAKNLHEAKTKFVKHHKVPIKGDVVASRDQKQMLERFGKWIR
jgi:hypothetical protein